MSSLDIVDGDVIRDGEDMDTEGFFREFVDGLDNDQRSQSFIKVFRIPVDSNGVVRGNSKLQAHLFTMPMGSATVEDVIDRIREKYIRAKETSITVRIMGFSGAGRGPLRFNRVMTIERENETGSADVGNQTDIAKLLQIMQQNSEAQSARTEAMMQRMMDMQLRVSETRAAQTAPQFDMGTMMQTVMQTTVSMLGVFQGISGQMRGAPQVDGMDQLTKTIAVVKQLQGLTGGGPAEDEGMGGILKALVPIAVPALNLMHENQKAINARGPRVTKTVAKPGAKPLPGPAQKPVQKTPTQAAPAQPTGDDMQTAQLKETLQNLCAMAARNEDIVLAADAVMSALPDEYDDQLYELVSGSATFGMKIALLCPETRNHASWFESLRAELLSAYEGDDDDDDGTDKVDNSDYSDLPE